MRGRRISALVATALLALAAAGCGGDDSLAPEVPGGPAEVKVPQSAQSPADVAAQGQGANDDATTDTDDSTTGTDTDSSGDADSGGTETPAPTDPGTDEGGGAAAPEATADGPSNDTPPPDGSDAQQFEDFCAQNPGAC